MGETERFKIVNKFTIWQFLDNIIKKWGKKPVNAEAVAESSRVRALNNHCKLLEEIIGTQESMIRKLSKESAINDKRNMEEKLIDGAIQMFSNPIPSNSTTKAHGKDGGLKPLSPSSPDPNTPELESGLKLSDKEINNILDNAPADVIKNLPVTPDNEVLSAVNSQGINISMESVKRAKELATARAG